MNELIAWIMTFMMTMIPVTEQSRRDQVRANKKDTKIILFETPEESNKRYEDIAKDLIDVVYDPNNKPLFNEPDGRAHTIAIMLSIMFHESGFRRDVDKGEITGRGDHGNSWCLMQIRAGKFPSKTRPWNFVYDRPPQWKDKPEDIETGFTGQDLVDNRKLCFYEGLKMIRWSYSRCGQNLSNKLKVYASGSCDKGGEASKRRVYLAEKYWKTSQDQRNWNDEDILKLIRKELIENPIEVRKDRFEKQLISMIQPIQVLTFNDLRFGWQNQNYKN